jgi:hypothetical protein
MDGLLSEQAEGLLHVFCPGDGTATVGLGLLRGTFPVDQLEVASAPIADEKFEDPPRGPPAPRGRGVLRHRRAGRHAEEPVVVPPPGRVEERDQGLGDFVQPQNRLRLARQLKGADVAETTEGRLLDDPRVLLVRGDAQEPVVAAGLLRAGEGATRLNERQHEQFSFEPDGGVKTGLRAPRKRGLEAPRRGDLAAAARQNLGSNRRISF